MLAHQDHLAIVRRPHGRSVHFEVTGILDVDDDVIVLDLANGAQLLAAFLEVDLIVDGDIEVVCGHARTVDPRSARCTCGATRSTPHRHSAVLLRPAKPGSRAVAL